MEEKLNSIYEEVIQELNAIGIDMLGYEKVGKIEIKISKRNNKRYGCCKQEEPDKRFKKISNCIRQHRWRNIIYRYF